MAHVLIIDDFGRSRLAHLRQNGNTCEVELEDETASDDSKLSWKVLGIATMALVSGAGWLAILFAAKHLFQ
ncbi:MAG TPA: hypothetical protein VF753_12665 [Terriglobales bacterium]